MSETSTVLILRALGLGDLLTAVPALRGLRAGYPDHRLVLAAPAPLAELAPLTRAVDELLPTAELGALAGPSPAVAVNLHGCVVTGGVYAYDTSGTITKSLLTGVGQAFRVAVGERVVRRATPVSGSTRAGR